MTAAYCFKIDEVIQGCIDWIKGYFQNNGPNCTAVIGMSGGKDSTIVAELCARALGRDRVLGVLMPKNFNNDYYDAVEICKELKINYITVPITHATSAIQGALEETSYFKEISQQTKINLPPRIRMATLYAVAQSLPNGGRVANTCNLCEDAVGYSTRWGDSVGDFRPLADLTVPEVVAIGDALGINKKWTHKIPDDGLCGKTDEENLGVTYEQIHNYIREENLNTKDINEKIKDMINKTTFKRVLAPFYFPKMSYIYDV